MKFRNATIDDLPAIVAIYNSTVASRMVTADTEPVSVADKLNWFNQHHSKRPLWVVENENNGIIGWISFQDFYGRPAYNGTTEISIYIDDNFRQQGLGKKMLRHAISNAVELQIHTMLGFIFEHNAASIKLFESFGFETWGNLKDIAIMDNNQYSLKILGLKIY
jgi:phosphinothricin acetyltransferase